MWLFPNTGGQLSAHNTFVVHDFKVKVFLLLQKLLSVGVRVHHLHLDLLKFLRQVVELSVVSHKMVSCSFGVLKVDTSALPCSLS